MAPLTVMEFIENLQAEVRELEIRGDAPGKRQLRLGERWVDLIWARDVLYTARFWEDEQLLGTMEAEGDARWAVDALVRAIA